MDTSIFTDRLHESIDISRRELRESAVLEDESRDIVALRYLFEDIDIDRVASFVFLRGLDPKCLKKKYL